MAFFCTFFTRRAVCGGYFRVGERGVGGLSCRGMWGLEDFR
jgi:hypothetical protein